MTVNYTVISIISEVIMESALDLRRMFDILRKHVMLIILTMLGFAVIAFGVAEFVITPKYTSETQILVNQKNDDSNSAVAYQNQQADVQMISTYKDIITNEVVLKQAKHDLANPTKTVKPAQKAKYRTLADGSKRLVKVAQPAKTKTTGHGYDVTVKELKNSISISNEQNSQVFALSVESDDPDKSAAMANEVASVFKTKIKKIMSVNNVTIVSKATANDQKTSPNIKLFILIGLVLGLLISVGYAFAIELMDTTVQDESFLTETLGLTNLGHVDKIKTDYHKDSQRGNHGRKDSTHRHTRV